MLLLPTKAITERGVVQPKNIHFSKSALGHMLQLMLGSANQFCDSIITIVKIFY
jgi:hypothetical protein